MPITPYPNTYNMGNKWSPDRPYGRGYVSTQLKPYLATDPTTPPYIIGSTTIFSTVNNTVGNNNFNSGTGLTGGAPFVAKMGSLFPKASPDGVSEYVKLSTLTRDQLSSTTVKKSYDNIQGTYLLGANTKVGEKKEMKAKPISPLNVIVSKHTNIQGKDAAKQLLGSMALSAASGMASSPQVIQLGSAALDLGLTTADGASYTTTPFNNLKKIPMLPYQDFRALRGLGAHTFISKRMDGKASAIRNIILNKGEGIVRAAAYAAASLHTGAYPLFNLESLYGWGEHGSKYALRQDFTKRSSVNTYWSGMQKKWKPVTFLTDPEAKLTGFRGDKVSVIDFRKKTKLEDAYQWNPTTKNIGGIAAGILGAKFGYTNDLIKFFFTGPKVTPYDDTSEDDMMVFRAIITSFTDSYNPSWTPVQYIGRADPNYHYSGYGRDINLDFTVYATDRDELKPIWRKLNALASYTAPIYDGATIGLKGPWMRFTLGDLFNQQPIIINSLYYTLADTDTTWEINIEDDPSNMQVPLKIQVSIGATVITDYLPQKGGKMYTLAKSFGTEDTITGNDNWLSDMGTNEDIKEHKAFGKDI